MSPGCVPRVQLWPRPAVWGPSDLCPDLRPVCWEGSQDQLRSPLAPGPQA